MKVWIIGMGEPLPTDTKSTRLFREGLLALYLAKRGHTVTWFNSSFGNIHRKHRLYQDNFLIYRNIRIELINSPGYTKSVSLARLIDHFALARNFRYRANSKSNPDVIYNCFIPPEVSYQVTKLKTKMGVPIVVDIRDTWPDLFYEFFPELSRPLLRGMLFWYRGLVSTALKKADAIISNSTNYLDWGLKHAGRSRCPFDMVIPPGYTPYELSDDEMIEAREKFLQFGISDNRDIIFFGGTMGRSYDFEPVIEAARVFSAEDHSPIFVLAGDGELREKWQSMANDTPNIIFTGWLNEAELTYLQKRSICGLQPYSSYSLISIPNKTGEYLSNGLPIISSLKGENERLLQTTGTGLIYESGNSLCEAIRKVSKNEEMHKEMSRNAEKTFRNNFQIDVVHKKIEGLLEKLVRRSR